MFFYAKAFEELIDELNENKSDQLMSEVRQIIRDTIKYAVMEASFTAEAIIHNRYGERHLPRQQERQEALFEKCKRLNWIAGELDVQPVYIGSYLGASQSFFFASELIQYLIGKSMTEMTTRELGGNIAEMEADDVEG